MKAYPSTPLEEFQQQCLTMVSALVESEGSLFCLFSPEGVPRRLVTDALAKQTEHDFLQHSAAMLSFVDNPKDIVVVQQLAGTGHAHWLASLLFWRQQRVEALVGLVRPLTASPFDQEELKRLEVVHPVIGHALQQVYLGPPSVQWH